MDPICLLGIGVTSGHNQPRNCAAPSEAFQSTCTKKQCGSENQGLVPSQPYDGSYILIPPPSALGLVHCSSPFTILGHCRLRHHPDIRNGLPLPCVFEQHLVRVNDLNFMIR